MSVYVGCRLVAPSVIDAFPVSSTLNPVAMSTLSAVLASDAPLPSAPKPAAAAILPCPPPAKVIVALLDW